eukprot:scaffold108340_cov18-Tisochrysis_lutea.AAC.2
MTVLPATSARQSILHLTVLPAAACRAAADALRKRDFISGLNDVMANMMSQMNYTVQGAPVEAVKVGALAVVLLACSEDLLPVT